MVALPDDFFDGSFRAPDLAIGPRNYQLGQAVLHAAFAADEVKMVPAEKKMVGWRVNSVLLSVGTVCMQSGRSAENSGAEPSTSAAEFQPGKYIGTLWDCTHWQQS
jgi:hypothetical protein